MEQRLSGDEPLFVDLDGALLEGSRFWEAFVQELNQALLAEEFSVFFRCFFD